MLDCHVFIGPPASGKSTCAAHLHAVIPHSTVVSTDRIREQLYGKETCQGQWADIAAQAFAQIREAIARHSPVIYDATNIRRSWRTDFLQNLADFDARWTAWHLTTPLPQCQTWNQQRDRRVPPSVIAEFHAELRRFPPLVAEGFDTLVTLNSARINDWPHAIATQLAKRDRARTNRRNRTRGDRQESHLYSHLLDFDRLMHLLSVLANHPGIGAYHHTHLDRFTDLTGCDPESIHQSLHRPDVAELSAVLRHQVHPIYADSKAIANDLDWLDRVHLFQASSPTPPLDLPYHAFPPAATHPYSKRDAFIRLIQVIRFVTRHPFCRYPEISSADSLVKAMRDRGWIVEDCSAALRKDIEKVLKPFGIMTDQPMRRGYYLGTGLLDTEQLQQLFHILQAQVRTLEDPSATELYAICRDRFQSAGLLLDARPPIRSIRNRTIVDLDLLNPRSAAHDVEHLVGAIELGRLLELGRVAGGGRFTNAPDTYFKAWPLQIVFSDIAWYVAYELADPPEQGLLQFERLDRLVINRDLARSRSATARARALRNLETLCDRTVGLFLGRSVKHQQDWLSGDRQRQKSSSLILELRFTDGLFPFICEGTQRFKRSQMKLSPPRNAPYTLDTTLFSLKRSSDPDYPHRMCVTLPIWNQENIDLHRWILGYGSGVKVVKPQALVAKIAATSQAIAQLYPDER